MKKREKDKLKSILKILIVIAIVIDLAVIAYLKTPKIKLEKETVQVTRVIDGDTFETENSTIRLLGINTPEKNHQYYQKATQKLKELIENKNITIIKDKENKDKYDRLLRYAFIDSIFVNEQLLKEGLANTYLTAELKYSSKLKKAEGTARKLQLGIWNKSTEKCANCIKIVKISAIETENLNSEYIKFENSCDFECNFKDWQLKDEANHFYTFKNFSLKEKASFILYTGKGQDNSTSLFWNQESSVWNDAGDSAFLHDNLGLVTYYSY